MHETLPEKINKLYTNYLSPQVSMEQINFLLLIAKSKNAHIPDLARDFKIAKVKANTYCTFFLRLKIISKRRNSKGVIVELTRKGEKLFARVNNLSKHKNQIEIIRCPKCNKMRQKSTHHIFPQKFFGDNLGDNSFTIDLCQECHDKIGEVVHNGPRLTKKKYMKITLDFIYGKEQEKTKKKTKKKRKKPIGGKADHFQRTAKINAGKGTVLHW